MCAIICSSKPTECSAPRVNRSVNYKPLPGDSDMRGRVTAYKKMYPYNEASLVAQMVKHLPTMWETGFDAWVRKILWGRKWQPTPILLPGKSRGWRSLVGYSPWGRKESDMTERLHFTSSLHFSVEGKLSAGE